MRNMKGFTLIELIVAIALLAVLISLVIPNYREFVLNNQRASAVTDLMSSLQYARAEAISRSQRMTVCRSNTPTAATPACLGGTGWENGWIIFIDADGDGIVDAGETVTRIHEALPGTPTLRGRANAVDRITFQPSGTTANNGDLTYCDNRGFGPQARRIHINNAGLLRLDQAGTPAGATSCT